MTPQQADQIIASIQQLWMRLEDVGMGMDAFGELYKLTFNDEQCRRIIVPAEIEGPNKVRFKWCKCDPPAQETYNTRSAILYRGVKFWGSPNIEGVTIHATMPPKPKDKP